MTKFLSPAALTVLNAWGASNNGIYLDGDPERLAAALRAVADEVVPIRNEIIENCWYEKKNPIREALLDIASELEEFQ